MKNFQGWQLTAIAEGGAILIFLLICAIVALNEIKDRLVRLARELPSHWRAGKFIKVTAAIAVTAVMVAHALYLISELYGRMAV